MHISTSSAWNDSSLFESPGFVQQIVASVLRPSATASDIFHACDSFTYTNCECVEHAYPADDEDDMGMGDE